ncbi:MAG: hypothetical protein M1837_000008 [Sclerophora amabilis]|nr:MAG: hypothetical protein M1837_000008 [Sclerophora amabilis]
MARSATNRPPPPPSPYRFLTNASTSTSTAATPTAHPPPKRRLHEHVLSPTTSSPATLRGADRLSSQQFAPTPRFTFGAGSRSSRGRGGDDVSDHEVASSSPSPPLAIGSRGVTTRRHDYGVKPVGRRRQDDVEQVDEGIDASSPRMASSPPPQVREGEEAEHSIHRSARVSTKTRRAHSISSSSPSLSSSSSFTSSEEKESSSPRFFSPSLSPGSPSPHRPTKCPKYHHRISSSSAAVPPSGPSRFIFPPTATNATTQNDPLMPRTVTTARTFLPPITHQQQEVSTPPSPPPSVLFSPHRRGARFLAGGLASEVQSWVLSQATSVNPSHSSRGNSSNLIRKDNHNHNHNHNPHNVQRRDRGQGDEETDRTSTLLAANNTPTSHDSNNDRPPRQTQTQSRNQHFSRRIRVHDWWKEEAGIADASSTNGHATPHSSTMTIVRGRRTRMMTMAGTVDHHDNEGLHEEEGNMVHMMLLGRGGGRKNVVTGNAAAAAAAGGGAGGEGGKMRGMLCENAVIGVKEPMWDIWLEKEDEDEDVESPGRGPPEKGGGKERERQQRWGVAVDWMVL